MKPKFSTLNYTRMKAYGNHLRVIGVNNINTHAMYDSGTTSVFRQQQGTNEGTTLGLIQYVGVLKDIVLLDYGPILIPVILFKCNEVKNSFDRWGNPTYKRDEDGFLLAQKDEPYVFPTQVQHVFLF